MNNKTTITFKPRRFRTTLLPSFILAWKGKHDARQGPYAVEAYINKLLNKAKEKEAELFTAAEHYLENTRKAASNALFTLSECSDGNSNDPTPTKADIYRSRSATARLSSAKMTLIDAWNCICSIHSIVDEHVIKTNAYTQKKLSSYFRFIEDPPKYTYNDDARTSYYGIHNSLDNAVKAFVESAYREEEIR